MNFLRATLLLSAIALGFVVVSACGNANKCGPTNCSDGCCDADGKCQPGQGISACGTGGQTCATCSSTTEQCQGGACTPFGNLNPDGGNPNAGCLQSCAGCCNNGQCLTGDSDTACGRGEVCATCGTGELCNQGVCVLPGCFGCKDSAGSCDSSGDSNAQACGIAGVQCKACTGGGTCASGACSGCNGCYDALGRCRSGSTYAECGTAGATCSACGTNQECVSGACQQKMCKSGGAACAGGTECCSGTCSAGSCATTDSGMCKSDGAACLSVTECCSQACTGGVCGSGPPDSGMDSGTCGPGTCAGCCAGGTCLQGALDSACGSNGQTCQPCGSGTTCQSQAGVYSCATTTSVCMSLGSPCSANFDCCTNHCAGGTCGSNPAGGSAACGPVTNVCIPYSTGTRPNSPSCDPCVQRVCAADPYCCENTWDTNCAGATMEVCDDRCFG